MGVPDPLNERPSISMLIGMRSTSPVNSTWVCRLSMPEVPSKICRVTREIAYLHDGTLSSDFQDLPLSDGAVSESYIHNLRVSTQGRERA